MHHEIQIKCLYATANRERKNKLFENMEHHKGRKRKRSKLNNIDLVICIIAAVFGDLYRFVGFKIH